MEKFAVDLDKVLDEFEFNEDRAEQMVAVTGKSCGSSAEIGDVSCQQSANQFRRHALKSQRSTDLASGNCYNSESSNTCTVPPAKVDVPSNGSSSLIKNGINHSQNICWQQDIVIQNTINSSSSNKLNVSGVFSSLNEYLNAGNSNIDIGLKNEASELIYENETENLEVSFNKSSSSRESIPFQDVISSENLDNSPCNGKKFSLHTCHQVDIPGHINLPDEGLTLEIKTETHQDMCLSSEQLLIDKGNLKSSPGIESNCRFDSLQGVPVDAVNSCTINEGDTGINITDLYTDVAEPSNAILNEASVEDDHQAYVGTSFGVGNSEENVKLMKSTNWSNIHEGSVGEGPQSNECSKKLSPNMFETNFVSSLSIPSEDSLKIDENNSGYEADQNEECHKNFNGKSTNSVVELNPIGFDSVDDYSEEELEKYLAQLCESEQNDGAAGEIKFQRETIHFEEKDLGSESKPGTLAFDDLPNDQVSTISGIGEERGSSYMQKGEEHSCLYMQKGEELSCSYMQKGEELSCSYMQKGEELSCSYMQKGEEHSCSNMQKGEERSCSNLQKGEELSCSNMQKGEELSGSYMQKVNESESDTVVENEVKFKSDFSAGPNLDVIPPCNESSDEGFQSNTIQEESDRSRNATISISMLNTSKSTANVNNVISIECRQTKNCIINGETTCVMDENDNRTVMCESRVNDSGGICCSEEKCTQLSDISDGPVCGNLGWNESVLHSNYSVQVERLGTNNSSDKPGDVSGCLVQVPKNGSRINVLGEEERPCRPKFLLLPSKIIVGNQPETSDNIVTLPQNAAPGLPGETPGTHLEPSQEIQNSNSNPVPEISGNLKLTSPDASDSSSLEVAISPVPSVQTGSPSNNELSPYALSPEERSLGKLSPFWVPDSDAPNCMLCDLKFTVLKRRHHCRACGKVLCSKCCSLKSRLEYMENAEARVCHPCFDILARVLLTEQGESASESPTSLPPDSNGTPLGRQPNPNNPMEYCSTIPPLEQAASTTPQPVPSVLVPVGVLKREGCNRSKGDITKQVMFSDGIRPGGDLTELDGSSEPRLPYRRQERILKRVGTPPGIPPSSSHHSTLRSLMSLEPKTKSYIPNKGLPPLATLVKGELKLEEVIHKDKLFLSLKSELEPAPMFALNRNLFVQVKILNLDCCVNRLCWCFSTIGMSSVGQDEIVTILEYLPEDTSIPKDIFHHLNTIYQDASRGNMVSEMGHTVFQGSTFLGSSEHGGFIYIRPSFQCLHKLLLPSPPYLVAVLFHRWEIPWAKVFPIRLMLRLGAEFRYYPCMLVSIRQRKPVFCEIGHTIINLLADFRNLSYTLPSVRGLVIHMEDRHTSILLPKNRYDQVARALNNSNDHVLALAANFSMSADSHLVCIQSHEDESYHTQAINIHNKPRKVTGASFVVFNGALKMSSNLTAKSSIVEDGLMVQITPDTIQELRNSLRKMQDFSVRCGPAGAVLPDEMVNIKWVQDDRNFNIGVVSFIDGRALDGIPSIRVHNGTDYMGTVRFIRWTEVFILQSGENCERSGDPMDISRLSESLARATCLALVNYLDLLAQAGLTKLAVRANIHPENVGYEAGSRGEKLPPIYMKSLDNELVPVLHKAASMAPESPPVLLELIFHVMLQ